MVSALLLIGDSRIISRQIPENSINTIITSPPYLWQRDYGHAGQIGHEITPGEYVQTLVEVFAALKPALRDDGSLWLNLGSTYASKRCGNFKPKDLIPTPWLTALALQNAGWYLRQEKSARPERGRLCRGRRARRQATPVRRRILEAQRQ